MRDIISYHKRLAEKATTEPTNTSARRLSCRKLEKFRGENCERWSRSKPLEWSEGSSGKEATGGQGGGLEKTLFFDKLLPLRYLVRVLEQASSEYDTWANLKNIDRS